MTAAELAAVAKDDADRRRREFSAELRDLAFEEEDGLAAPLALAHVRLDGHGDGHHGLAAHLILDATAGVVALLASEMQAAREIPARGEILARAEYRGSFLVRLGLMIADAGNALAAQGKAAAAAEEAALQTEAA